eukprot:gene143-9759_t
MNVEIGLRIAAFAALTFSFCHPFEGKSSRLAAPGIKSSGDEFDERDKPGRFLANEPLDDALASIGPFHTSVGDKHVNINLTWFLYIDDRDDNTRNDIEIEVAASGHGFNWVGIGFANDDDTFGGNDWLIVWKSKTNILHHKDCNTMKGVLHFDRNQDYEIVTPRKLHTFHFTVRRALNTGDKFDVELKSGKTNFIWAYGSAKSFSKIKSEIKDAWKSNPIIFYNEDSMSLVSTMNPLDGTRSVPLESNKIRTTASPDGSFGDNVHKDLEDVNNKITPLDKVSVSKQSPTKSPLKPRQGVATVIVKKTKTWYEVVRLKEYSVYYAIIGSSAMLTGIIVIMFACCCSVPRSSRSKSKVAFYKV